MATPSATKLLMRDEFVGFAKSKVIVILWILLPLAALGGFLLLPAEIISNGADGEQKISAVTLMTMLMSSTAGAAAALLATVSVVSEKNRNVYVLLSVRPIKREVIIWAKFIAICGLVTAACVVAIIVGFVVDAVQGHAVTSGRLYDAFKALLSMIEVIAMSTAVGLLFGVLAKSILGAVLMTLYIGQNLVVVPMLPVYLHIAEKSFGLIMSISAGLTIAVLLLTARMFKRLQL